MGEWKEYKLEDIVLFQRGHDLPKPEMIDGKYPVAGSNGIIGYHNNYTTKGPGVTIGRSGNIGNPRFYETDYWAHNTVLYVKEFRNGFPKFIYYFLLTLDFTQFNAGSAVPTLNRNHIHDLRWRFPEIPEQRTIASILSSLDDKINLLHRQNKTLEALAETLFRQWFVEEADESWEEVKLSELGNIVCGKTPSKKIREYFDGEIPFIKIPDMHGKTFVFETEDSLTELGMNSQLNKTIPPKSICISCIATVGLVVFNAITSQTNQQINSIVPYKEHFRYFIYLKMLTMKDELLAMASGGTATDNLNTGNFSNIDIQIPEEKIIISFHQLVEPIFNKIFQNQIQIRTLTQLRDTLLPKLMSGEVRVKWEDTSTVELEIDTKPIYTIGHSNHSIEKFIRLLEKNRITIVVDVRTSPFSKYNPQYNRDQLQKSLSSVKIKYLFMGKELGGRPSDIENYYNGVADYEKLSKRQDFNDGISRLLKGKKEFTIALLCSEKDPLNCHRMLLVGRALKKFNFPIKHILADGEIEDNSVAEMRLLQVTGLKPTLFDSNIEESERIEEAYRKRSLEIAYKTTNGAEE